ncbi:MAG: hypothetical protein K9L32_00170 [Chromatiaceae bacterium]|nr:hypothetical protein [Chromatiaceae bacterium]
MMGIARGASIIGEVIDQKTGAPVIPAYSCGVRVNVYQFKPENQWYEHVADACPDDLGEFSINELPAGTYYVYTGSERNYVPEYYDDAGDNWNSKEILVLAADTDYQLNLIELEPVPIGFINPRVISRTGQIPSEGGLVRLTASLHNTTNQPISAVFWINAITNHDGVYGSFTVVAPRRINLPAGEQQRITSRVRVPGIAPGDQSYSFEGYVGLNPWASLGRAHFGGLWKPANGVSNNSETAATPSRSLTPSNNLLPARIAEDGTVLDWREAVD